MRNMFLNARKHFNGFAFRVNSTRNVFTFSVRPPDSSCTAASPLSLPVEIHDNQPGQGVGGVLKQGLVFQLFVARAEGAKKNEFLLLPKLIEKDLCPQVSTTDRKTDTWRSTGLAGFGV